MLEADVGQMKKVLACEMTTLRNLQREGVIQALPSGKFDVIECCTRVIKWQRQRLANRTSMGTLGGISLTAEKAKLAQAQTEAVVTKNLIAKGELVHVNSVALVYERELLLVREKLLTMPGKLADRLASKEHPRAAVEEIIRTEVYEALQELHEAKLDTDWISASVSSGGSEGGEPDND